MGDVMFVWIIVGCVAAYSLFSFVTGIGWFVSSDDRNNVVFAHRNKSYGAYQIRKSYNNRLAFIVLGLAALIAAPIAYNYLNPKETVDVNKPIINIVTEDSIVLNLAKEEPLPPPPPPTPPAPKLEKIAAFVPPVITDEKKEADDIKIIEEGEKVGEKDQEGDDEVFNTDVIEIEEVEPQQIEKVEDPVTFVEEEAEFPGGFSEMGKFINDNIDYPQEAMDLGIKGRVTVRFVVEKTGEVSNVSVAIPLAGCKACDRAAVKVIEKMPSWTPGKNGGRAVRTWVTLPIKFEIQ
jgi:protein TonB